METVRARDAATTARTVAAAMRDSDFETFGEALAPDVVLHSPITGAFPFEGRQNVLELVTIARGALENFRPVANFGDDETRALLFDARVAGQEIQGLDVLRFDDEGRVREFRVFIRPLPGLAALMAALAPRVASGGSRARTALVGPPTRLQAFLARTGDRVGVRLLRRRFSRAG